MALSYCGPFQCNSELNLNRSLHIALQNSGCASLKSLEEIVKNGHFHFLPFERNKLQWVDEKKGSHLYLFSCDSRFGWTVHLSFVEFCELFFLFSFFLGGAELTERVLKMSNSSFERYESTTFQLSPLNETYKYDVLFEAIECCTCASDIFQRVYEKAELIIQNR